MWTRLVHYCYFGDDSTFRRDIFLQLSRPTERANGCTMVLFVRLYAYVFVYERPRERGHREGRRGGSVSRLRSDVSLVVVLRERRGSAGDPW